MDWLKQGQQMFKTWMDAQQTMLNTWKETAQDLGESLTEKNAPDVWRQTVQTWENSFKNLLETQALWARMWARTMSTSSGIEGSDAFAKAVEDMTKLWVDAQQQLMANWFALFKNLQVGSPTGEMQKAMASWRENMQKVMDAQTEWTKQWAESFKPAGDDK